MSFQIYYRLCIPGLADILFSFIAKTFEIVYKCLSVCNAHVFEVLSGSQKYFTNILHTHTYIYIYILYYAHTYACVHTYIQVYVYM